MFLFKYYKYLTSSQIHVPKYFESASETLRLFQCARAVLAQAVTKDRQQDSKYKEMWTYPDRLSNRVHSIKLIKFLTANIDDTGLFDSYSSQLLVLEDGKKTTRLAHGSLRSFSPF